MDILISVRYFHKEIALCCHFHHHYRSDTSGLIGTRGIWSLGCSFGGHLSLYLTVLCKGLPIDTSQWNNRINVSLVRRVLVCKAYVVNNCILTMLFHTSALANLGRIWGVSSGLTWGFCLSLSPQDY